MSGLSEIGSVCTCIVIIGSVRDLLSPAVQIYNRRVRVQPGLAQSCLTVLAEPDRRSDVSFQDRPKVVSAKACGLSKSGNIYKRQVSRNWEKRTPECGREALGYSRSERLTTPRPVSDDKSRANGCACSLLHTNPRSINKYGGVG
jgi:hypothetical protein